MGAWEGVCMGMAGEGEEYHDEIREKGIGRDWIFPFLLLLPSTVQGRSQAPNPRRSVHAMPCHATYATANYATQNQSSAHPRSKDHPSLFPSSPPIPQLSTNQKKNQLEKSSFLDDLSVPMYAVSLNADCKEFLFFTPPKIHQNQRH